MDADRMNGDYTLNQSDKYNVVLFDCFSARQQLKILASGRSQFIVPNLFEPPIELFNISPTPNAQKVAKRHVSSQQL
jgi:hypothetical protein